MRAAIESEREHAASSREQGNCADQAPLPHADSDEQRALEQPPSVAAGTAGGAVSWRVRKHVLSKKSARSGSQDSKHGDGARRGPDREYAPASEGEGHLLAGGPDGSREGRQRGSVAASGLAGHRQQDHRGLPATSGLLRRRVPGGSGFSAKQAVAAQPEKTAEAAGDVTEPIAKVVAAGLSDAGAGPAGQPSDLPQPRAALTLSVIAPSRDKPGRKPARQKSPDTLARPAGPAEVRPRLSKTVTGSPEPRQASEPSAGTDRAAAGTAADAGQARTRPAAAERSPGAARARSSAGASGRWYRLAGLVAAVLILVLGGALVYRQMAATATSQAAGGQTAKAGTAPARLRAQVAAWVISQVSPSTRISCDPVMCGALVVSGVRPADLVELGSGSANSPLSSDVVIATAALRTELGNRLGSVYAPGILASFGSGSGQIDVRVIAKHGAAAYLAALKADVTARKSSASTLLESPRITLSGTARSQLTAGEVDTRLQLAISGLATSHPVYIVSFADSGPDASRGMPLRAVDLAQSATARTFSGTLARSMLAILRGPGLQYRPASAATASVGGRAVLRILFAAPSPLGLLDPAGAR
ncbi:MAG TPA: hypothetical protein VGI64_01880 [Streptosporangiaceae bacterium]